MTISTTIIKNSYSGDASNDTFAYQFKISTIADMQVIIRSAAGAETVKTLTTHYTVTGAGESSGGNVVFEAGHIPAATETVILRRSTTQTQALDLVENDPFTADSVENAFDKNLAILQELQEQANRSLKISRTNTMTSTEFTNSATDRASKVLAFDADGELSVTQELGTYQGTDATTTTAAYVVRDIIKSTTAGQLNNVYICIANSVIGDTLTDTDHFALLVDAYSAATSATAAAASATDAETAQTAAETAQTAAELAETNAETAETNAETAETNAATSETNAATSETNAGTSETNAATSETNAGTSETNAATSASNASTSASTATTQASNASTSASNASTSETNAGTSETNAGTSASNASTSASNASTSETNAATSANEAAASADAFDDVYLGSKSSDPTTDNDGDALAAGMLYYNTTSNIMRIYSGSAWENVAVSTSGFATLAGVETLTNKTLTSPKINEDVAVTSTATELNLLDGVSGLVQADFTKLAAVDSTAAELNTLDGLSRGSIIYGNASAATAILTKGTADQVLTSDGTDISWGDASSGSIAYGLFSKIDPTVVAWDKTGAFTMETNTGLYIEVNGDVKTIASATSITMPSATAGTDYAIWCTTAGALEATTDHVSPPSANARKVGGFHYAAGGNATGTSGGDTTASINEYSLWDLKWKPNCPDPRGMTLVGGHFWSDIYLTGVDHHTNGTSYYNVTIADGGSPPKVPSLFGGNGSTTYGSYTWWEQAELLSSHGKRPPTYQEFSALAYGTTEASSRGSDPTTTQMSATDDNFTSKWGVIQSTGCMYTWGNNFGGPNGSSAWTANTEGRGSTYNLSNVVLLGGAWADTSRSGSRYSKWNDAPTTSTIYIGSRGVCDHKTNE